LSSKVFIFKFYFSHFLFSLFWVSSLLHTLEISSLLSLAC
jgi:hypothetical protein